MDVGVFLPVSGRSASRDTLMDAARKAEAWGYASVWAADRVVMPWSIDTAYPYSETPEFIVPPDRPFLECLTVLAFLAAATDTIRLGASVVVMNFRHPLHWLRQAASIDRLSEGRLLLGVGIGWMEEEFAAIGAPFAARGRVGDEQLEIARVLLEDEHCSYSGEFYGFEDVAFYPKAHGASIPIWVGGEGKPARRRAARYGDAWFPYLVRTTPEGTAALYREVGDEVAAAGRDPDDVVLACCRPVEITDTEVAQQPDRLRGTPEQVAEALWAFAEVGVSHVALQFVTPRYPERMEHIERFSRVLEWV